MTNRALLAAHAVDNTPENSGDLRPHMVTGDETPPSIRAHLRSTAARPGEVNYVARPEKGADVVPNSYYIIECFSAPLTALPYTDFIWKVIGRTEKRVMCVPAYDFRSGRFIEDEAPILANFVVESYNDAEGNEIRASSFMNVDYVVTNMRERLAAHRASS